MINQQPQQANNPISTLYETGIELTYTIASVFTLPVEYWLRPGFGTRYFHPVVTFFAFGLMVLFTGLSAAAGSIIQMIPFQRYTPPSGLINFNLFFAAFFFTGVYHNFRLWRLMIHPELEEQSRFANWALPVFAILPKARQFHFCRIVWEPLAVLVAAITLSRFYIIDHYVALYLTFAAFMLFAKNAVVWYRTWEKIRDLLDLKNQGPIIAKIVEGTATDEELASIQLSHFPKNVSPEIRKAATAQLAGLPPEIEQLISPVEPS